MKLSTFWRLVWKEYRLQRALWIAMAALTLAIIFVVYAFTSPFPEKLDWLYGIALGFPVLYAVGCGAMLFAGEHEAGTFEFHRGLPIRASQVFLAKMAFAVASTAALMLATGGFAGYLSDWTLPGSRFFAPGVLFALAALVTLLWTALTSLFSKRVLVAAILGMAAASLSIEAGDPTLQSFGRLVNFDIQSENFIYALCALALVLAIVDAWLGSRWFLPSHDRVASPASRSIAGRKSNKPEGRMLFASPDPGVLVRRLAWQQRRQSLGIMFIIVAVIASLALVPELELQVNSILFLRSLQAASSKPSFLVALALLPLLGVCAFLGDQRQRSYRFLGQRSVPAKYVWRSRLRVLLIPLVVLLPILLGAALTVVPSTWRWIGPSTGETVQYTTETISFVLLYTFVAISTGQLFSMLLRSAILAGVFSVLVSIVLAGWCGLMWFWGVPTLWSILPIPLAFLLATRLRTANWLLERNTLRAWLAPALVLIVPLAAILTAVPYYRVYSIPKVDTGYDYVSQPTEEERGTIELYREAIQNLKGDRPFHNWLMDKPKPEPGDAAWVKRNAKAIELALEASRGQLRQPIGDSPQLLRIRSLPSLLLAAATVAEKDGKLDAALERYVAILRLFDNLRQVDNSWPAEWIDSAEIYTYQRIGAWGAKPRQTADRITAARYEIQKLNPQASLIGAILLERYKWNRVLDGDLTRLIRSPDGPNQPVPQLLLVWLSLPWERERARRVLDLRAMVDIRYMTSTHGYSPYGGGSPDLMALASSGLPVEILRMAWIALPQSYGGDLVNELRNATGSMADRNRLAQWRSRYLALETARQATGTILALQAWKAEHGTLPKTLDELVKRVQPSLEGDAKPLVPRAQQTSPILGRDAAGYVSSIVPLLSFDPYSQQPFRYFPEGLKTPLNWKFPNYLSHAKQTLPADTPFIWSAGPYVRAGYLANPKDATEEYQIDPVRDPYAGRYELVRPLSEHNVWEAGWPFAIP